MIFQVFPSLDQQFSGPVRALLKRWSVEFFSHLPQTSASELSRRLLEGCEPGLFHGDLHGGNLISCSDGRIGVLDWGLCLDLSDTQRSQISRLTSAILLRKTLHQLEGVLEPAVFGSHLSTHDLWSLLLPV